MPLFVTALTLKPNRTLLAVLLCAIVPLCLYSQPRNDTLFVNTLGEYPLYKHLYVYKTNKAVSPAFVFDSVKPASFLKLYPDKGFNSTLHPWQHYWLVATFKNNLPHPQIFYYWLNAPYLFTARIYRKEGVGNFTFDARSGYENGFPRQNTDEDVEYYFTLQAGEATTILMDVENEFSPEAYFLPKLADYSTFADGQRHYQRVIGIFIGVMLAAFVLNVFLGILVKETIHYWYALYVVCICFEALQLEGIAVNFIPESVPNAGVYDTILTHIVPAILSILMSRVMQKFLGQARENSRVIKPIVDTVNYFLLAVIVLNLFNAFIPYSIGFQGILLNTLLGFMAIQVFMMPISAIEKIGQTKKNIPAWFYLIATLFTLVGLAEYMLCPLGFDTIEWVKGSSPNLLQIGLMTEALVVFMGIVYRTSMQKKALFKQQQDFINSIISAQEGERKNIADELHTEAGTIMNLLGRHIANLEPHIKKEGGGRDNYSKLKEIGGEAANLIRNIAHSLLPKNFEPGDLFTLLEERIVTLNQLNGIRYWLITDGDPERLTKGYALTVYRTLLELANNILKHSGATNATLQVLINNKTIRIVAEDDGIGFDTNAPSQGSGIKSIVGNVEFLKGAVYVDSNPNGTTTVIEIPIPVKLGQVKMLP